MVEIVKNIFSNTFGSRVREERIRLGYNQKEFATIGGVKRASQYLYEQSERPPTMIYLSKITEKGGADLIYIMTGIRSSHSGGKICITQDILDKVLALADKLSRDDIGRPYAPEVRNTLTKAMLIAVSDQESDSIDWCGFEKQYQIKQ